MTGPLDLSQEIEDKVQRGEPLTEAENTQYEQYCKELADAIQADVPNEVKDAWGIFPDTKH